MNWQLASLLTLALASPHLYADDSTLTLQQAVSEALEKSPKVQRAESVYEEAGWKRVETYAGFLPNVNITGTYLLDKKYAFTDVSFGGAPVSVPQIVPAGSLALNAQLPLFDGFASTYRWLSARSFEAAAQDDFDWARFQIERDITLQYYKALSAKMLREVAAQNVKTLEDHLKDIRLFKKAGISTNYDVLRVEVQASEAKSELLNAEDESVAQQNKLAEMLGRESEVTTTAGELPTLPEDLLKSFDTKDTARKLDLRALEERQTGYARQESAAAKYWVPKLSLFGQYQYYNNLTSSLTDYGAYRNAYQVGLLATWNIFDGGLSFAKSKESVQQRVQSDVALTTARLKTKQDVDFWRRKYGYFTAVSRARTDDVEKSEESVRLAKEGRKVGARTNTDLLDAEVELYRAKANAVNAKIGSIESLINLELATGQPLYRFR